MYIKRNYGFWMTFNWSKKPFIIGGLYAFFVTLIFVPFDLDVSLPWQPMSVLGIAVAFYLGFKNNSSYDRTWEARKIWGGIVNNSRSFGSAVISFLQSDDQEKLKHEQKALIYRHVVWLTALRYQLRLARPWEHTEDRVNGLYIPNICEEYIDRLDKEIEPFISEEEVNDISGKSNMAAQVLARQARELQRLRDEGYMDDFRHMRMHELLGTFYDDQGRSERIKNFPFPRQYASTALWTSVVFCVLLPFGLINTFSEMSDRMIWMTVPFSALITWVFFLMEKIGDYSENPFEGTYNDVPITSIARGIEIDLRQMINDENIPPPIQDQDGFLM